MKQCLRLTIFGTVQGVKFRSFIQQQAQALGIEGTVQNAEDGTVLVFACGVSEHLDQFIDMLYKGCPGATVDNVVAEPMMRERDFRGVFRILE